ncbi:hypothetical protein FZC79_08420 [Rossellomorea vietnamensis]|uniref:Uncharacterized protein n=2 Tax=Rossellomorea TaxID=2837508 RepID=A0A5D4KFV5_9BACI|nr:MULTISPECIES: hypothetical protein [Rossellomorea]TYR76164.1 hypothetical protein FZC79_08420 [Rossellomorea vietnamensis]TYS74085.1 hypothetical protein FZC80_18845 [Rossellomorea aquimaris]
MNKKNLFLSVPLAAGIALAGCSDEESQEDTTIMEEDNSEQTDENMNDTENSEDNTGDPDASIDDEGSDEDNEGMLNEVPEDPYGEGTDEPDLDTDEDAEEF